jgi:predicted nucleic acid-binding Zn ribbon protein
MSDPVKRKCSECETLKLKRLVGTGAGVMFKGSGFYETDYRSDSYRKGAKAEKEASKPKDKDKKKKGDSGKSETSTSSKD